jgi:hypothetical protein
VQEITNKATVDAVKFMAEDLKKGWEKPGKMPPEFRENTKFHATNAIRSFIADFDDVRLEFYDKATDLIMSAPATQEEKAEATLLLWINNYSSFAAPPHNQGREDFLRRIMDEPALPPRPRPSPETLLRMSMAAQARNEDWEREVSPEGEWVPRTPPKPNPSMSTGTVVALGLAAAAIAGAVYWFTKKKEPELDEPGGSGRITKDLSFAAGEVRDSTGPEEGASLPDLPIKVNVGDTITIEPVPMSVSASTADLSNAAILQSLAMAGRGWKFMASKPGETSVTLKGSDGKIYSVMVKVSA